MDVRTITIPASGVARVEVSGVGFRVAPGRPVNAVDSRPGSYPVVFSPDNGSRKLVTAGHSYFLDPSAGFQGAQLEGEAGDTWVVTSFATREESLLPAGSRGTVPVRIQQATAVPTVAPTLASDGWKVRPGTRAHTFYGAGTLRVCRIWVRSAGGNWFDTGEDLDFISNAVQLRTVLTSGDRVALVASAAAMTLEVDAEVECE